MILKSEKVKCTAKDKRNGQKDGREWKSNDLYFDDNGINCMIAFVPEVTWNKAEVGQYYEIKYYLSPFGKISINDITATK